MECFLNKIEDLTKNTNNQIPPETFVADQFTDELVDIDKIVNLILKEMEQGFRVDVHTLMNLKRSYESTLLSLKEEMQGKLGRAIRVNSNRDLGDLLFQQSSSAFVEEHSNREVLRLHRCFGEALRFLFQCLSVPEIGDRI